MIKSVSPFTIQISIIPILLIVCVVIANFTIVIIVEPVVTIIFVIVEPTPGVWVIIVSRVISIRKGPVIGVVAVVYGIIRFFLLWLFCECKVTVLPFNIRINGVAPCSIFIKVRISTIIIIINSTPRIVFLCI